mmetsp:Transcript_30251/g.76238  ORF Transcript_30251/g.76238 Transcript_30251/m.76238 type:complete len:493 (+) Transcript_30251:211-1689(+)
MITTASRRALAQLPLEEGLHAADGVVLVQKLLVAVLCRGCVLLQRNQAVPSGRPLGRHRVPAGGDQLADGRGRALRQLEPQVVLRHLGHHALAQAAPALQVGKRDLLRQQLPQDDGVAVHVGRLAVALVQQNLGRHPPQRADFHDLVGLAVLPQAAQAKVRNLEAAVRAEQEVGALEVAVHQARHVVDVLQPASELDRVVQEAHVVRAAPQLVPQGAAIHVLQHHCIPRRPQARAVEAEDVGVPHHANHADLAHKLAQQVRRVLHLLPVLPDHVADLDGHRGVGRQRAEKDGTAHTHADLALEVNARGLGGVLGVGDGDVGEAIVWIAHHGLPALLHTGAALLRDGALPRGQQRRVEHALVHLFDVHQLVRLVDDAAVHVLHDVHAKRHELEPPLRRLVLHGLLGSLLRQHDLVRDLRQLLREHRHLRLVQLDSFLGRCQHKCARQGSLGGFDANKSGVQPRVGEFAAAGDDATAKRALTADILLVVEEDEE